MSVSLINVLRVTVEESYGIAKRMTRQKQLLINSSTKVISCTSIPKSRKGRQSSIPQCGYGISIRIRRDGLPFVCSVKGSGHSRSLGAQRNPTRIKYTKWNPSTSHAHPPSTPPPPHQKRSTPSHDSPPTCYTNKLSPSHKANPHSKPADKSTQLS